MKKKGKFNLFIVLALIISLMMPMAAIAQEIESFAPETVDIEETISEGSLDNAEEAESESETIGESESEETVPETEDSETEEETEEEKTEETVETEEEEFTEDGPFVLGNSSENILNGGVLAIDGSGNIYFSNTEDGGKLYLSSGGAKTLIVSETSANINTFGDKVYYTTGAGTQIREYNSSTGAVSTVYESSMPISQMYVVDGHSFYMLTEQGIYIYSSQKDKLYTALESGGIAGFIPTAGGMIYSTGALFQRNLYFDGMAIASNVFSFYTVDGYLIFTSNGSDYQVSLNAMNESFDPSVDVQNYSIGGSVNAVSLFCDDSDCEICEQNAKEISLENFESYESEPIRTMSAVAPTLSQGVQNIVKRARQQHEVKWTPLKDISSWAGESTFYAGTTYYGIPYGQPVYASYVPWSTDLEGFVKAVNNPNSKMYTDYSSYNRKAPYYSSDCSSFVSWAWGLNARQTTSSLHVFATKVANQSVYSVQVGDAFIASGVHAMLVTNVGYDANGVINSIEITEQTPPKTLRTVYGAGGKRTLESLTTQYLNKGYVLYRNKTRDNVIYSHSCAAPVDDSCYNCDSFEGNDGGGDNGNAKPDLSVSYRTHVQTYGWENQMVSNGVTSGTVGEYKRLEGIQIKLENAPVPGGIQYRTHVQTYGWEDSYASNGAVSGTVGEAKRLEAIQIRLTGNMEEQYDVYYRVHAQTYGWLDWAKNGESAGTEGLAKRLEGIQILLVEKGGTPPSGSGLPFVSATKTNIPDISYKTHVQTFGWQDFVSNGASSGTEGQYKRLEGICINVGQTNMTGGVSYRTHVQTYGWQNWVNDGAVSGTTGEAKRLEAIQIKLTGELAEYYDVYYRVHSQTYGWLGWAKNGESAGTEGLAKRLEAIQIKLVLKGQNAPGTTYRSFIKK